MNIIAGGRDYTNYSEALTAILSYANSLGPDIGLSIVSGMARGADTLGDTLKIRGE